MFEHQQIPEQKGSASKQDILNGLMGQKRQKINKT
jgi:hypothetical protein